MRILVTGANGFVGRCLVPVLRAAGHEVVAATRAETGDIGPHTDWRTLLAGCEAVIHLAARVHLMHDTAADPLAAYRAVNTAGTHALALQAQQAGVRRFVFASSVKVNGEATAGRPFSAGDVPAPADPYGLSKFEAEQLLLALPGMEAVVVRPALVYGPGVRGNLERLVRLLRTGLPLPLAGIDNRRALLDVHDLCDLLLLCATRPEAAGRIFLAADAGPLSTPALLRLLAEADGHRARLFTLPSSWLALAARLAGRHQAWERLAGSLEVDAGPAREVLGWQGGGRRAATLRELVASIPRRAPRGA